MGIEHRIRTGDSARRYGERNFFTCMSLAVAAVVFAGFARTFFLRPLFPDAQALAAPEPYFMVHGVFFASWTALLVIQAVLIRARRLSTHRFLGWVGVGLAAVMVVVGIYGALIAANRPGGFIGVPLPPLQFMIFPILDVLLFALFVGLAVSARKRSPDHKRWILLATINLLEAAIVRIPIEFIGAGAPLTSRGLTYLFIAALVVWDLRSTGRIHPVTLWGGLLTIISFPLRMLLMSTGAWQGFAGWLAGLAA